MRKTRHEAFSDGVIAILITIMVLELKIPDGGEFRGQGFAKSEMSQPSATSPKKPCV